MIKYNNGARLRYWLCDALNSAWNLFSGLGNSYLSVWKSILITSKTDMLIRGQFCLLGHILHMDDSRVLRQLFFSQLSTAVPGALNAPHPPIQRHSQKESQKAARWTLLPGRHWQRTDLHGEPLVTRLSTHLRKSELWNYSRTPVTRTLKGDEKLFKLVGCSSYWGRSKI